MYTLLYSCILFIKSTSILIFVANIAIPTSGTVGAISLAATGFIPAFIAAKQKPPEPSKSDNNFIMSDNPLRRERLPLQIRPLFRQAILQGQKPMKLSR